MEYKPTLKALMLPLGFGKSKSIGFQSITNVKANKGVTVYVIPDKAMPNNDSNQDVELIQPLSAIKARLSKKDYEKYLKGEL